MPGPGKAMTLEGTEVAFDWRVHFNGGIAAHMATLDKGANIWATHPILTIQVTDKIDLDSLSIPENVTVLQVADLTKRYLECLSSTDKTVRGWCCSHLAPLAKLDVQVSQHVARLLADEDAWVQLNALGAVTMLDSPSQHVDTLKKLIVDGEYQVKEKAQAVLTGIQELSAESNDKANTKEKKRLEQTLEKIASFCENRK